MATNLGGREVPNRSECTETPSTTDFGGLGQETSGGRVLHEIQYRLSCGALADSSFRAYISTPRGTEYIVPTVPGYAPQKLLHIQLYVHPCTSWSLVQRSIHNEMVASTKHT